MLIKIRKFKYQKKSPAKPHPEYKEIKLLHVTNEIKINSDDHPGLSMHPSG